MPTASFAASAGTVRVIVAALVVVGVTCTVYVRPSERDRAATVALVAVTSPTSPKSSTSSLKAIVATKAEPVALDGAIAGEGAV